MRIMFTKPLLLQLRPDLLYYFPPNIKVKERKLTACIHAFCVVKREKEKEKEKADDKNIK